MSRATVALTGVGLHTGAPVSVTLRAWDGPTILRVRGLAARLDELAIASTARATTVAAHDGLIRLSTVEHAFAALAGLGLHAGVEIEVDGPEMPLLDGGAAAWCSALAELDARPSLPRLRVAVNATVAVQASRYEFSIGEGIDLEACVDFDDRRIAPVARWTGDAQDFRERIAPARTFALARDVAELERLTLARHVDPRAVVLIAPEAVYCSGGFSADEPARHKLLDWMGDLYLHGGPPMGRVRAVRPGHTANALAMAHALSAGICVREEARDAHPPGAPPSK